MKKMTKILAVIFSLLMLLSLAACSESGTDKNGDTTPANQEEIQNNEAESGEKSKTADNSAIVGSWEYSGGGFTYTFNEDGTGIYDTGSTVMKFTYELTDTQLSILYEGNTSPTVLEYSIDGNTANIKDSSGNETIYNKK
ncbi:MAG: hypothetical protein K5761_02790 [Clostridiales bacterium]|nr:hypothetical protein [Clostridiales bacterium]